MSAHDQAAAVALATSPIYMDIFEERAKQERLRAEGRFTHTAAGPISNPQRLMILMEEIGEAAECIMAERDGIGADDVGFLASVIQLGDVARTRLHREGLAAGAPGHHRERKENLDKELVQCAAVVVAWLAGLRI